VPVDQPANSRAGSRCWDFPLTRAFPASELKTGSSSGIELSRSTPNDDHFNFGGGTIDYRASRGRFAKPNGQIAQSWLGRVAGGGRARHAGCLAVRIVTLLCFAGAFCQPSACDRIRTSHPSVANGAIAVSSLAWLVFAGLDMWSPDLAR
jgi:hypothetical protein